MSFVGPRPERDEVVAPVAAAAPRDFAKSTLLCLGYVLWELLHGRRNFAVLGSETKTLAEDHVASLAAELTGNRRILYDFAPRIGRLKTGDLTLSRGGRVLARGAGQQFRGLKHRARRPDLVILDDLESDKLAINPKRVKALLRWIIGTVYPAIDKAGSLADALKPLMDANISVQYMYAFAGFTSDSAVMIFRFSDTDKAIDILQQHGMKLVDSKAFGILAGAE
jgi:hypothetical protein